MTLREAAEKLGLKPVAGLSKLPRELGQGYVSDLLSDVMANAKPGDIWVTLQIHQNIVAVATLKELAGIILIGGRQPEKQTLAKAEEEQVPLLLSDLPAFEVVGRLYQLGITGRR
ncbi:MAG: DRTGG domain-containing protein [Planctomycetaceae bacterium]